MALVLVLVLVLAIVLVQSERGFRTLSLLRSGSASIFGYFFASFILLLPVWLFYVTIGEFSRRSGVCKLCVLEASWNGGKICL